MVASILKPLVLHDRSRAGRRRPSGLAGRATSARANPE